MPSYKSARDANSRQARVEAGLKALDLVSARLSSPKSRLRTRVALEEAAAAALAAAGSTRWVGFRVHEFAQWLSRANSRVVRTTRAAPRERLEADLAAMRALPPRPLHLSWHQHVRLPRDYYVRLDTNDYSVDPRAIGRLVDVSGDLERVRVRVEGRLVAEHARVWARGMTLSDEAHVARAALLRKDFQRPRVSPSDDLTRDLFDYDRTFGLTGEA